MNVVQRENTKIQPKQRNEFVRKDLSLGIRGAPTFLPPKSTTTSNYSKVPRYNFSNGQPQKIKRNSMGPPLETPRSLKRKLIQDSTTTKPESSSSGRIRPRVLVSDSAADNSQDFSTPRNRPTALRYISSSSRGGNSGTRSARSTSASVVEASVILAISEGRGMARGEIGIAAVDLRHPHLVLCQFSDSLVYTHTMTKINYFNPVEIIVPHTFCEGVQPNQLYQLIKEQFPTVNLTTVQRRHFNDAAARQQIQSLCAPQYSSVYLQVLHKFYALTAAAAVLKYVEYIQCIVFARESLKIEYHSSENTMIIDVGTATQLELVQPLVPSAGQTCCLLGVLGPTYTVGGIRALRAAILQPSCNREVIEARLDAVEDLIENDAGLMVGLQDVIKNLSDVDKILLLCLDQAIDKNGEAQLNQTLLLKTTMDMVPKLVEALDPANSSTLRRMKLEFENSHYKEISQRIRSIIQEDAHVEKGAMASLQRCFAVKPEINGLLDVARRTYSELIEDIQKIVEQLSETYDLPLRLNQNMLKGFHIVLPISSRNRRSFNIEELPDIFIQVQNNGASVSMTTEELVVLDQQAKESLNEIQKMSNIVISGLLKDLRPFMSSLYKLCENVAELDILLALAQASTAGSYIRPQFGEHLEVRNSVHPLLDYNSQTMPVPNDINASPEHNFSIITGPNMGGKSIYIKQIAIMQVMAQVGCFLPATSATLRLCDRLFSRIGFNDSVELNASTYVLEIKEIQHILQGLTSTSLVIIDELCRGTCTEEGTSIAWAICEELLTSDAFTFFTTHFMYLTRLQDLYVNVVNLQTEVMEDVIQDTQNSQLAQRRLVYQHKIVPGVTKIKNYGLALASKTNLPVATVKLAEELAELIMKSRKPQEIIAPDKKDEKLLYELNYEIRKEIRKNGNSEQTIKQMLEIFKTQNPELMQRLREKVKENTTDTSTKTPDNSEAYNKDVEETISSNKIISSKESFLNKKHPKKPVKVIYSTTDAENDKSDSAVAYSSYSLVRSSNELLNTVLRKTDHNENCETNKNSKCEADFGRDTDADELYSTNYKNEGNKLQGQEFSIEPSNDKTIENEILDSPMSPEMNSASYLELHINDNIHHGNSSTKQTVFSNDSNNTINNSMLDLDEIEQSDIAEALTQIIEEYSQVEISTINSDDDLSCSFDEDLMQEAIGEVHDSLVVDSIVLTPPYEFRD